jgi:hypothetical protein
MKTLKFEERIAELERAARINLYLIDKALQQNDWETIARLAEGLARCAHLRTGLKQLESSDSKQE